LHAPRTCRYPPSSPTRRSSDLLALGIPWHFEEDMGTDAPLERGIEVRRQVRREDHHAVVPLQLLQEDADDSVRLPLKPVPMSSRSEEHTSELQSRFDLVCRLLL